MVSANKEIIETHIEEKTVIIIPRGKSKILK